MNICVCYERDRGGETVATEAICREFKKISTVKLIAFHSEPLRRTDSINFFLWNVRSIWFWIKRLFPYRNHLDWVYTTTYTAGFAAALLMPFNSYRICWHFHGERIPPRLSRAGFRGVTHAIKRGFVSLLHTLFLRVTSLVIVPSSQGKTYVIETLGVSPNKLRIIGNGVDHRQFYPISRAKKMARRRRLKIPQGARVLLAVGRLEPQKNIEQALAVVAELNKIFRQILLVVLSPAPSTQGEVDHKRLLRGAAFTRFVEDPQHREQWYQMADMVISLSHKEYFPLSLLEAAASRRLYVAAKGAFLKRIDARLVLSGDDESLVKQLQAILDLPKRETDWIENKLWLFAQEYTWKKTAGTLLSCFSTG